MRTILFLLLLTYCTVSGAQVSYVGKGKIILTNDSIVAGEIKFKPAYANEVDTRKDSLDKWRTYNVKEVKSFEMDTLLFEPRIPRGGEVAIKPGARFMEIVVKTRTGLNMYIDHFQEKVNFFKGVPLSRSEILTIYVSIPDNIEDAYDLNSFKFIPKFDEKAGKIVEACPALAEKVRKKEKGYFYNMMNQQKAADIWADIILEYKKCIGGNN